MDKLNFSLRAPNEAEGKHLQDSFSVLEPQTSGSREQRKYKHLLALGYYIKCMLLEVERKPQKTAI